MRKIIKNNLAFLLLVTFISVILCNITSCDKKDDNSDNNTEQLEFIDLSAESDTVFINSSTNVTATATGYDLSYNWASTGGIIYGSGAEVLFGTPNCTPGDKIISCSVKDGNNNSETKQITITVL